MSVKVLSPTDNGVFSKELLNYTINKDDIYRFKKSLKKYLEFIKYHTNEKEIEKLTNSFLSDIYQNKYYVNTKDPIDIAIFNEDKPDSDLAVIIEAKSPENISQMIHGDTEIENINVKSIHELARYYSVEAENFSHSILHLIVTDGYVWYFFNSGDFRSTFYNKTKLLKFKNNAEFYYNECSKYLSNNDVNWKCIKVDLRDYNNEISNDSSEISKDMEALYRLFSPEYLLGKEIKDDNIYTLNKEFYNELLYILGLEEYKDENTKKIQIRGSKLEIPGTFLYNVIDKLITDDSLEKIPNLYSYGKNESEQLFNISLDLCITWLNRVLFLKLLEGQLKHYHKNNIDQVSFMSSGNISSFDELYSLFFQVLAVPTSERRTIPDKFKNVPYLNSSLFDQTPLEKKVGTINILSNEVELPLYIKSVLKYKKRNVTPLWYLLEFLDRFDFSGESSKILDKDKPKPLINATVLGLIFEKINGYKEGSYYTPGFITMHICREAIVNSVIKKFNSKRSKNTKKIESLVDIYNSIGREWTVAEANNIINNIKICDPAVGSGHFLVSALNEILRIKSELGILCDSSGKVLHEVKLSIENDELKVIMDDGSLFEYCINNVDSVNIQKTLFSEKRTIIENCLFGVDLNPKSVSICRLRLWIELLKNTYYNDNGELETLPNIDINIKEGDSLISRYKLDVSYTKLLKWKVVNSVEELKSANTGYKTASNNKTKRKNRELISKYESNRLSTWNREAERIFRRNQELIDEINSNKCKIKEQVGIDGVVSSKYTKDLKNNIKKLENQISNNKKKIKRYTEDGVYSNAFEWRFDFPDVLDDNGKFIGFDCIIGNPPYIKVQDRDNEITDIIKENWSIVSGKYDISLPFIELGYSLLNSTGCLSYISSNQFFVSGYGKNAREFFTNNKSIIKIIDLGDLPIFENALTYTAIISLNKDKNEYIKYTKIHELPFYLNDSTTFSEIPISSLGTNPWVLGSSNEMIILDKIAKAADIKLHGVAKACYGIISGDDDLLIPKEGEPKLDIEDEMLLPLVRPEGLARYADPKPTRYSFYPYKIENGKTSLLQLNEIETKYPKTFKFIQNNENKLKNRKDSRKTMGDKNGWYGLVRSGNLPNFLENKIFTPGEVKNNKFSLDSKGYGFFGARVTSIILNKEKSLDGDIDIKYLLSILNSKLIEYYLHHISPPKNGGYYSYSTNILDEIPIVLKNVNQSYFIELVDKIHELKNKNRDADTHEYEEMIDNKIFELYGLSKKEINLIKQET